MARIRVTFDGDPAYGSALLMHSERLADPIDPYAKWVKEVSKKLRKTDADHEELGRREWLGAGYWLVDDGPRSDPSHPYIPTWNMIRCLQEAATLHKLGRQVLRGIVPVDEVAELTYDGSELSSELWKAGTFHLRKGVGVGQKKVPRTRPIFAKWKATAEMELDLRMLDVEQVHLLALEAGIYIGLGDNRPRFGRFLGSAELIGESSDFIIGDLLSKARASAADAAARRGIEERDAAHRAANPNGSARRKNVAKEVAKT